MAIDVRLANKGRGEPRDGLVQQGRVHVGLGQQHAADLAANGWAAEKTTALEQGVATLEATASVKVDASVGAQSSTRAEHKAVEDAKVFVRRLRNALPAVLRESAAGVTADAFYVGERLGRSSPRISAYLLKIAGAVGKLDAALTPYFKGQAPSALLASVKSALDAADATQEVSLAGVPAETQKVYEAKGRVLELIEDMNRVAKNAFDGQAELVGKFNKDLLLRARKARVEVPGDPAPAPPAG